MAALFFVHEATRVFYDRLVEHTEKGLFYQFLSKELENYFQVNLHLKNSFKWCVGQKCCFRKVCRHLCNISEGHIVNSKYRFDRMTGRGSGCLCSCTRPLRNLKSAHFPKGLADVYTLDTSTDPSSLSSPLNFSFRGHRRKHCSKLIHTERAVTKGSDELTPLLGPLC